MKPRSDSYEATLSAEQREELHALLSSPELSLAAVRKLAPKWAGGPHDGSPPSIATLSGIAARLRREQMLVNVEATAKLMEAVRRKVGAHKSELASGESLDGMLDLVCDVVGQEVLQKTVEGEDPKNRTAALRALLKRADQKQNAAALALDREKFAVATCELFLKWFADKRAQEIANGNASNAEKIALLRQEYFKDVDALEKSGQVEIPR